MKTNMGSADRIIRLLVTAIVAALFFSGIITGTTAIVLAIVALVFVLTGLIGFCPLYTLFGIKTCTTKVKS
jgi:hypothetical protein